jgi:hypothetical protein
MYKIILKTWKLIKSSEMDKSNKWHIWKQIITHSVIPFLGSRLICGPHPEAWAGPNSREKPGFSIKQIEEKRSTFRLAWKYQRSEHLSNSIQQARV